MSTTYNSEDCIVCIFYSEHFILWTWEITSDALLGEVGNVPLKCVCVVHRTGRRQVQQHNSRSSASALHCDLLALIHTTSLTVCTWWPKFFWYALTSSTINRFWKLFHCRNQEKTCNNTITKDPTTPQVCRYTTLWSIKCLKSNNWKRDDFCNNTLHMLIN